MQGKKNSSLSNLEATISGKCYALNDEHYIFRHEFYGGLIHSRTDGERYELDHSTFSFLRALSLGVTVATASGIVNGIFNSRSDMLEHSLAKALKDGLVKEVPPPLSSPQNAEIASILIDEYEEAISRSHLRAPLNLSIYPLMVCHLDCQFCYVTDEKWLLGSAQPSQWIDIIRQAKAAGIPFISFLGGDPALYRGMPDLIRAADSIGIKSTMTTNGVRLLDRLFDALVASDSVTPVVSIQSTDNLHKQLTGRPYEEAVATIRRLSEAGKSCYVNMVYTRQTMDQVRRLIDLSVSLNVSKFTVGVFTNIGNASLRVPSFREYRELHEAMLTYKDRNNYDILIQTEGCQLYTAYPDASYMPATVYEQLSLGCEAGQSRCEIMHDGTMLGCALQNKNNWAGDNVFEVGFQEAWDRSKSLKRVRELKNKDSACTSGKCSFSGFCNGGCPAHNEKTYGEPDAGGDHRCEIRHEILSEYKQEDELIRL